MILLVAVPIGCNRAKPPSDGLAAASGGTATTFKATEVSGIDYGRGVVIADTEGRPRRLEDFRDSVTVVFFGFASCPDICPTTLTRLQQVRKAMGPAGDRMRVLFVTVDPERDTPDRLRTYVKQFDPDFVGLRPEPAALPAVVKSFHAIAVRMPIPDTDTYMMDHSAVLYVYDRATRLRLIVQPDFTVADLAGDLSQLARG